MIRQASHAMFAADTSGRVALFLGKLAALRPFFGLRGLSPGRCIAGQAGCGMDV
jgi:hypothetical protein